MAQLGAKDAKMVDLYFSDDELERKKRVKRKGSKKVVCKIRISNYDKK